MKKRPSTAHKHAWVTSWLLHRAIIGLTGVTMSVNAAQLDIPGPAGSSNGNFGGTVTVLPNGNFVVTDTTRDFLAVDVGAVYLYSPTGALLSTWVGSTLNDHVGSGGITVLANGNFVISSPGWRNGTAVNAGAVTWASGTTGTGQFPTPVSSANSVIGTQANDAVGLDLSGFGTKGVTALLVNGNYVVSSSGWDNALTGVADVGAVTWVNGVSGLTLNFAAGAVSPANSLIGTKPGDQVGSNGVTALSNGNFVVASALWNGALAADVGAITWGGGNTGLSGEVSLINSLLGSTTNDRVGSGGVTALKGNGNYVVASPDWANGAMLDAGAATWGNGGATFSNVVSTSNSLVGASYDDAIGIAGVTALTNGNYVISSPAWDGLAGGSNLGAVTWGNGSTGTSLLGTTGEVSAANSFIGTRDSDNVGLNGSISGIINGTVVTGVTALSNGNYVVASPFWDKNINPVVSDVGAVTWGNGNTGFSLLGTAGPISAANSLTGTAIKDWVGRYRAGRKSVFALSVNGNYVIASAFWDGSASNTGAVTWANGSTGLSLLGTAGEISSANSLVGAVNDDQVGYDGVTPLTNGNYVINSSLWNNGGAQRVGAATWANGLTGFSLTGASGPVSATNSLIGAQVEDNVGSHGTTALSDGNFVVASPYWDNGATQNVGAVTWANGGAGLAIAGTVSPANSLIGTTAGDRVGAATDPYAGPGVTALSNGRYVIASSFWDNGVTPDAGAVTAGGNLGSIGTILSANSILGTVTNGGPSMVFGYSNLFGQLVVGQPAGNIVSLLLPDHVFANGFEDQAVD